MSLKSDTQQLAWDSSVAAALFWTSSKSAHSSEVWSDERCSGHAVMQAGR